MTHDNEAIVRHAYHTAEGSVMDVAGFVGGFAKDGVINLGHAGVGPSGIGNESYRGEHLGDLLPFIAKSLPDVHRELHRVNVLGQITVGFALRACTQIKGDFSHGVRYAASDVRAPGDTD